MFGRRTGIVNAICPIDFHTAVAMPFFDFSPSFTGLAS